MKKKKLKLNLKKDVISNLQAKSIVGGATIDCNSYQDPNGGCNSNNGCTGGPNETMTCAGWSCGCNQ